MLCKTSVELRSHAVERSVEQIVESPRCVGSMLCGSTDVLPSGMGGGGNCVR